MANKTLKPSSFIGDRRHRGRLALIILFLCLLVSLWFGAISGPYDVSIIKLIQTLFVEGFEKGASSRDYLVLVNIRFPRILLGLMVGSALAVSGVLMQGLFRNPLADPGIMGVSAGAGLGAVLIIVLGASLPVAFTNYFGSFSIILGSFIGGLITTFFLYAVATRNRQTSIATMLLAGIALGALSGAALGILVFIANDQQLRDITFWNLGSLAGATWSRIGLALPFILLGLFIAPFLAQPLNALSLGESVAGHLGFSIQRIKNLAICLVALMCGGAVAVSGGIGFIGIVVPHILRLTIGPNHRYLIPCSALLGAILLILADTFSRYIVAPSELPIGIVTALFGAPIFLWILLKQRGILEQ